MDRWIGWGLSMTALGVVAAAFGAACGIGDDELGQQPVPEASENAIINGADATSASWNAVGALGRRYTVGFRSFCTATLISPTVVLTAKHCAVDNASDPASPPHTSTGTIYFLVGPKSREPVKAIKATAVTPSQIYRGGYTGLGSDVALYTLSEPINDITPLKVVATPPAASDVGGNFVAIGYGVQNAQGSSGTRKFGKITLRAVSGAPAPLAFANIDEYVAAIDDINPEPMTPEQEQSARNGWERPINLDYETFVGNATSDVQVCNGDSGGPLLKEVNGKYVVYGVASTTMTKSGYLCSHGGMYATFGASTRQIIAKAIGETCWPKQDGTASGNLLECGLAPSTAQRECKVFDDPDAGPPAADAGPPTAYETCLKTSCCAETTACFGDPECTALRECFIGCPAIGADAGGALADGGVNDPDAAATATSACSNACYKARAQFYGRYLGFTSCARACSAATADAGTN
jgi:hypothetical protein